MLRIGLLRRYVLAELRTPTLLAIALWSSLLLMNQFFFVARLAIQKDLDIATVARLIALYIPQTLVMEIPMGTLLGTMLAIARLSADHEIVAMNGAGLGVRFLLGPVVAHGLATAALALVVYGFVQRWAIYEVRTLTVMQIQQSHFLTTDLFTNLFMFLSIMLAVEIVHREVEVENRDSEELSTPDSQSRNSGPRFTNYVFHFARNPLVFLSLGFGFALGMAMASKINAAALAILLPAAFAIRYFQTTHGRRQNTDNGHHPPGGSSLGTDYWMLVIVCLIAGALATLISFRIFQPYAFEGIGLNPQWIANIKEQRAQATGDADLPWNLQWAKRSHLYSFINLTVWGLGLPLGILA